MSLVKCSLINVPDKCSLLNVLCLLFCLEGWAQKKRTEDALVPYRIKDNWGFANAKGELKIPATFEEVDFFLQDLAKVKKNGLWGLIDQKGNTFLPCAYQIVYGAGKATRVVVCQNNRWGFLPTYLPEKSEFDLAYELIRECGGEGLLGVMQKGAWGAIDAKGKLRIPITYQVGYTAQHSFLPTPQITLPTEAHTENPYLKLRFVQRLARVSRDGLWGYLNESGIEVIKVQYPFVGDFSEDLVAVIAQTNVGLRLGFLNSYNDTIVPLVYDVREGVYQKTAFQEGLALVGKGGKLGFIDKLGNVKINFEYAQAHAFSEGRAWVSHDYASIRPTWHMIDTQGRLVFTLPTDCDLLEYDFRQGFVRVRRAGKENFLNRKGEFLLNTWAVRTAPFQDDLAEVAISKADTLKVGFINSKGNWAIAPLYDYAPDASLVSRLRPYIRLRRAGKFGILDSKGREIVPFEYEAIELPFYLPAQDLYGETKRLPAQQNGKWGYLNPQNKWAIAPEYEKARPFSEGYAKVMLQGKWGYINPENRRFWR